MARFVMTNRRAGKFLDAQKRASREAVENRFHALFSASVDVVSAPPPSDDLARRIYVLEADPREVAVKSREVTADVIIEPAILHWTQAERAGDLGMGAGESLPQRLFHQSLIVGPTFLTLTVTANGAPLRGAEVVLTFTQPGYSHDYYTIETTDSAGRTKLKLPHSAVCGRLAVHPPGGYWSVLVPTPVDGLVVDCPPLPSGEAIDWWHRVVGIDAYDATRGSGIKVGVIDSGFGPHPCLTGITGIGNFFWGTYDANPASTADVDTHGSHVCGIIGARPVDPAAQHAGIAPGASLFAARVVPIANGGATQADITAAIDELSRTHRVDLINISLGAASCSACNEDAIKDARERGTLCICAAGNKAGAVVWPAALPEAVAVTAFGDQDVVFPAESLSASRLPTNPDRYGHGADHFFLANFSNSGAETDATGPGVGIISTMPERFGLTAPYAVMDGTSMASPIVCGTLAVLLAASPAYQALTGAARAEEARAILRTHCATAGLAAQFQGYGIPRIP